ncbi:MAG: 50S ribosomal protein L23 [Candidatus Yanofskybacteria bacterium RIFCSPHIGHO2_02_FULL_50_12]|uniref:Large ribosomal subunit protein uL23 n=1 Tax=Candidatus Yanofskybacteria bacterium RIFCSPHIGHO2_02_FULL_50_12 TaxID=1802685 RepID=A0A1F8FZ40_9BACT|nr:MAG: 50S ribosomal protein L23 [Candidatus Yanofskybacteria bacterium RIFCSPHIGHO2_02_FULL_50_12]
MIAGNSVLKNFYVSEKAARLEKTNQYMFAVTKNATKSEIKKQVTKQYNVRVVAVNILNMPQKIKTVNRREGVRPGFKKAIVTLVQGDSIDQAKA